jgi:hypothetical protein
MKKCRIIEKNEQYYPEYYVEPRKFLWIFKRKEQWRRFFYKQYGDYKERYYDNLDSAQEFCKDWIKEDVETVVWQSDLDQLVESALLEQ